VDGPAPFQIFPAWLGKQSKRGKHRRLLEELRGRTGGEANLLDTRSALRVLLFDPKTKGPKDIVARLDTFNMTRDDMLETLVETCFTGDESSIALDTKTKGAITREWKKLHPTSTIAVATKETDLEMDEGEDVGDDDD
jgi:Replication factor RFC1 C terminal domain